MKALVRYLHEIWGSDASVRTRFKESLVVLMLALSEKVILKEEFLRKREVELGLTRELGL